MFVITAQTAQNTKREIQGTKNKVFMETLLFWQDFAVSAIERFLKLIYTLP